MSLVGCEARDHGAEESKPSDSGSSEADSFRIATWNVRNLFDDIDSPNDDEVLSAQEYRLKLSELADVLNGLKADFVALEEVENLQALQALNQRLTHPYPQLGLIEGNDQQRGIDVCFLSRLPIKKVRSHLRHDLPDLPDISRHYSFSRDCLEVQLDSEPGLTILVNHFKSQRGDKKRSATKRRAQSLGVLEIVGGISKANPGQALLVLGDLNDSHDSWSVQPLFEELMDPFATLPSKKRVTHRFRGSGLQLDHILLNEQAQKVLGPAKIWTGVGRKTSDHCPVSVQLKLTIGDETVAKRVWDRSD